MDPVSKIVRLMTGLDGHPETGLEYIITDVGRELGIKSIRAYGLQLPGDTQELQPPCWYAIWQEQQQGDNYRYERMAFGRLELYFVWPVNLKDPRTTAETLHNLAMAIKDAIRDRRQQMGLLRVKHFGHRFAAVPGYKQLTQIRSEYELLIA